MISPILPPPLRDAGPLETIARGIAKAKGIEICSDASYRYSSLGALAQAAVNALTEAGYAVVPVEPTKAMERGGAQEFAMTAQRPWIAEANAKAIYRAMITAAPPLNTKEGE